MNSLSPMDPRQDLAAAYDARAGDREAAGEPEWRKAAQADLVERLGPGAELLEVGAGVGYASRWFADRELTVVATDLSAENVARCREKGLRAEVADMGDLPFPDGSFDAVWAASCLMHIPNADLPGTLDEIARVIRPGGLLWTGTWGSESSAEGTWEEDWYEPKRFYSLRSDADLQAMLEDRFRILSFDSRDDFEKDIDWHYQMTLMARE